MIQSSCRYKLVSLYRKNDIFQFLIHDYFMLLKFIAQFILELFIGGIITRDVHISVYDLIIYCLILNQSIN